MSFERSPLVIIPLIEQLTIDFVQLVYEGTLSDSILCMIDVIRSH